MLNMQLTFNEHLLRSISKQNKCDLLNSSRELQENKFVTISYGKFYEGDDGSVGIENNR